MPELRAQDVNSNALLKADAHSKKVGTLAVGGGWTGGWEAGPGKEPAGG